MMLLSCKRNVLIAAVMAICFMTGLAMIFPAQTYAAAKAKITISKSSYTMVKGSSVSLKAKSNGKLSYKTTNKRVATVSSKGKVTAKAAGKAKIKISAVKGKSKTTKYVTIKVKNGGVIQVLAADNDSVPSEALFTVKNTSGKTVGTIKGSAKARFLKGTYTVSEKTSYTELSPTQVRVEENGAAVVKTTVKPVDFTFFVPYGLQYLQGQKIGVWKGNGPNKTLVDAKDIQGENTVFSLAPGSYYFGQVKAAASDPDLFDMDADFSEQIAYNGINIMVQSVYVHVDPRWNISSVAPASGILVVQVAGYDPERDVEPEVEIYRDGGRLDLDIYWNDDYKGLTETDMPAGDYVVKCNGKEKNVSVSPNEITTVRF